MSNDTSKLLSREDILGIVDIEIVKVDVPEWSGHVFVKTMTAGQRDAFEAELLNRRMDEEGGGEKKPVNIRAAVLQWTMCDAEGNLLFSKEDIEALSKKSGKAADRVFGIAKAISKISEEDEKEIENFSSPGRERAILSDSPSA